MADALSALLETTQPERLATGFVFTEGPLWHPEGFYYFVDMRQSRLYRVIPGKAPELVRDTTGEGNGTTFDLQGRLVICEGGNRRVTRWPSDGQSEVLMDRFEGKRLNRPNDVVCQSDGSIYFTDPGLRVPLAERELPYAGVYRIKPDGATSMVADCEYPNGLAFSPDERDALRRQHALDAVHPRASSSTPPAMWCGAASSPTCPRTRPEGVPDGMKVDVEGRVYCTGPGGTWVFSPDGAKLGIIRTPEVPANLAFGGPDLKTLFFTAHTSVYTLRMKCEASRIPGTGRGRPRQDAEARYMFPVVPTQPVSETSTMTPSGPVYFTSTLPPCAVALADAQRLVDIVARLGAGRGRACSAISSRLSTWKPMWWMPLHSLPRSTPATASFLKLRMARLRSPSLR